MASSFVDTNALPQPKLTYWQLDPQEQTVELETKYRQTSNISRTKSQNLNVSRLVLQLSLPNPLKPGIKSRMKM